MPIRNIQFAGTYPYLRIKIINPDTNQSIRAEGIVDTGASSCALPGDFAGMLGHSLTKGIVSKTDSAGGQATSYAHTTTIEIFDFQDNLLHVIEKIPVGY